MGDTLRFLCWITILSFSVGLLQLKMASAGPIEGNGKTSNASFPAKFFGIVAESHAHENLVFSPASIRMAMTLVYLGAEGDTAREIQQQLQLGGDVSDKESVATNVGNFLKENFKKSTSDEESDSAQLNMANGIFVNDQLHLAPEFEKLAESYLRARAEKMNFASGDAVQLSVETINSWVEHETNSKIKDLLKPDTINEETSAVLVNTIYFKAKWAEQFSELATHKANFNLGDNSKAEVDMMFNSDIYKYGEFKDYAMTALELPYKDSDISMLLLLPNQEDGLKNIEANLLAMDFNYIADNLKIEDVQLFLPKFKIEFEMDLKEELKKLGVTTVFSDNADLSKLFENSDVPQKVSEAKHKAYLDINEGGSEAAAATFMKISPMSLNFEEKTFRADHPFVFVIRKDDEVFFIGHVAKF